MGTGASFDLTSVDKLLATPLHPSATSYKGVSSSDVATASPEAIRTSMDTTPKRSDLNRSDTSSSVEKREIASDMQGEIEDTDSRARLEKKLLRKVDLRMGILVVIYILNYVGADVNSDLNCPSDCSHVR